MSRPTPRKNRNIPTQKQQNNNNNISQQYYSQPFSSPNARKDNNRSQYASHNGHTRANSSQRYLRPSDQFPVTSDYESDAYYIDTRPPPPSNALMNRTNPQINLSVLKRYVPDISEVLEVEPKVGLYEIRPGLIKEWRGYKIDKGDDKGDDKADDKADGKPKEPSGKPHELPDTDAPQGKPKIKAIKEKPDIEGPMFLCTQGEMVANETEKGRNGACIFILNEKGPISFMINLTNPVMYQYEVYPTQKGEDQKQDPEYAVHGTFFMFHGIAADGTETKTYGATMPETEEDRKERENNGTKKELTMSSRGERIGSHIELVWKNARAFKMQRELFGLHDGLHGGGVNVNPAAQGLGQEINMNVVFGLQNER